MKKLVLLFSLFLLVFVGGIVSAQDDALNTRLGEYATNLPQGYNVVRLADFQALLIDNPDVLLVDVREVTEYEAGHIENAVNIPIRTLTQNLNQLPDLDAPIVIVCKGGGRAMLAAVSLQILGYTNVKAFWGGFDAWVAEDLPVSMEGFTFEVATAPEFDPEVFAAVDAYMTNLPQGFGFIPPADLAVALVENPPVLIDVRSADELTENGYIEGATNIWINEFWANIDQLPEDKDAFIVVYCGVGIRGTVALVVMNLLGYTNVRNLSGGFNGWVAANNPIVAPEPVLDMTVALTDYFAGLPETFNAIRIPDLKAELDAQTEMVLVDVRTVDEFAEGFIPGAFNIPLNEFTDHLDMLPNLDANIVIYCGSGHRSAMVMMVMNMLGYTNVRSLLAGYGAWAAGENPTTTDVVMVEAGVAPAFDEAVFAVADDFIKSIPQGYWTVRPADLSVELVENPPVLVDVRTEGEYGNGFIAGALHLPLPELMSRLAEIPTDVPVVLYDNPTHRSTMALVALRLLGYENVRVLAGGTGGWEKAGFTLEK
ncbi:MAG: rhodanese-like domain-containing protein [Anaerolineae bacterium]|jgi:rhodanese-related sulfurtransferase|nr:rhodanese-like domain-containing protein [Anaerolineae bacterium]